jgi:hypothetical protein
MTKSGVCYFSLLLLKCSRAPFKFQPERHTQTSPNIPAVTFRGMVCVPRCGRSTQGLPLLLPLTEPKSAQVSI